MISWHLKSRFPKIPFQSESHIFRFQLLLSFNCILNINIAFFCFWMSVEGHHDKLKLNCSSRQEAFCPPTLQNHLGRSSGKKARGAVLTSPGGAGMRVPRWERGWIQAWPAISQGYAQDVPGLSRDKKVRSHSESPWEIIMCDEVATFWKENQNDSGFEWMESFHQVK